MLVGVVGGNLQGIEATYLAQKAGWEVIVVDRKPDAPASGLCERYIQLEVTNGNDLEPALKHVDLVIPALENQGALAYLDQWTRANGIPFAFDPTANAIASSKVESNHLFTNLNLPAPAPWPTCGLPVIAKPSLGSGSHKITVFNDTHALQHHIQESNEEWVIQEFVEGPSYSLEIVGFSDQYIPLTVTDLRMDAGYDCKRVLADNLSGRLAPIQERRVELVEHPDRVVDVLRSGGDRARAEADATLEAVRGAMGLDGWRSGA